MFHIPSFGIESVEVYLFLAYHHMVSYMGQITCLSSFQIFKLEISALFLYLDLIQTMRY